MQPARRNSRRAVDPKTRSSGRRNRARLLIVITAAVVLAISTTLIASSPGRPSAPAEQNHSTQVAPASLAPANPSKEYIYAGSRLLASEEPPPACAVIFNDVPASHPYFQEICIIARRNITAGCSVNPPLYCPDGIVTREQMAVFIEKALGVFNPPTPPNQRFVDVGPERPSYPFIDDFAQRGITAGCSVSPPMYCPDQNISHDQMAVFMEKAVGLFNPPTPGQATFCDVPTSHGFFKFIEDYSAVRAVWPGCNGVGSGSACNGIAGCTTANRCFCPTSFVTRAQMARILVRNFNLN
jgi:hypothetical protein